MTVVVVTAAEPIVTWEEAKAHLREETDDEKAYVVALVAAAQGWIDGPAGWLGRSIGPQLLEWEGCQRAPRWRLPYGPILAIESVETDVDTTPVTVPATDYGLKHGHITSPDGIEWVMRPGQRVQYWAGYGRRDETDPTKWQATAPAPIKQAVLLLVGQWFRTRSAVNVGNIVNEMPFAVEALLSPYRVWSC